MAQIVLERRGIMPTLVTAVCNEGELLGFAFAKRWRVESLEFRVVGNRSYLSTSIRSEAMARL